MKKDEFKEFRIKYAIMRVGDIVENFFLFIIISSNVINSIRTISNYFHTFYKIILFRFFFHQFI
jgi:hypothetical protein